MAFYSTTSNTTSDSMFGFAIGTIHIRIGGWVPPPPRPAAKPAIHPCAVLGVPCGATPQQVAGAYRLLAKAHHPDLGPEGERGARTKRMAEINHAHDLLLLKHREGR
jgi:DnaJ-domain-containing protein 1